MSNSYRIWEAIISAQKDYPGASMPRDIFESNYEALEERIEELEKALEFYADPETYFAIAFFPDNPSGEFMNDFSDDHGHYNFNREMPGKLAREILKNED